MHDVVIRGGRIVDGTGRPGAPGDVAIDGGVIAVQRSTGSRATLVNGRLSVLDGEHTGVRAGAVLRHR
jgi:N-acyl-D-aspartate/D-glutamate deacylase